MYTHTLHFPASSRHQHAWKEWAWALGLALVFLFAGAILATQFVPDDTLAAGIEINSVAVGGLSFREAEAKLLNTQWTAPEFRLKIHSDDATWEGTSTELGIHPNWTPTLQLALRIGREGSRRDQFWSRLRGWWQTTEVPIQWTFEEQKLADLENTIDVAVKIAGKSPEARVSGGSFVIDEGKFGQELDRSGWREEIEKSLNTVTDTEFSVPLRVTHIPLTSDGRIQSEKRLGSLINTTLELSVSKEEPTKTLTPKEYFPWLELPDGFHTASFSAGLTEKTKDWNRDPIDAQFEYDEKTKEVKTFVPDLPGRNVKINELTEQVLRALVDAQAADPAVEAKPLTPLEVAVSFVEPKKRVADVNPFGIKERIGVGTSTYFHSIPNRVYNIKITSERLHATLVAPGEEFSFNKSVGEVSRRTGYKTAYVISGGRTVLGDGGGVCQVSTTAFRAALNAGLPITKWKPHSYRVGYYEQTGEPGFDATVYAPSGDFRFKNDTGNYLLVSTTNLPDDYFLKIEIWGVSDGRTAEIKDYKIWNQRPAPATLYIEDPTLPAGKRQQVDWSAPGADTKFTYEVRDKDGTIRTHQDFVSHFQPWRAIFLVGKQ